MLMLIKSLLSICMSKNIGVKMSFKTIYTCNRAKLTRQTTMTVRRRGMPDLLA